LLLVPVEANLALSITILFLNISSGKELGDFSGFFLTIFVILKKANALI